MPPLGYNVQVGNTLFNSWESLKGKTSSWKNCHYLGTKNLTTELLFCSVALFHKIPVTKSKVSNGFGIYQREIFQAS